MHSAIRNYKITIQFIDNYTSALYVAALTVTAVNDGFCDTGGGGPCNVGRQNLSCVMALTV